MSEPSKQSIQRTLPRKKKRNQLPIGLLVFALMWGWLCEYVATAMLYWRDRRGAA